MRKIPILLLLAFLCGQANAGSTINPAQPAPNAPLASAPVRNNFLAAFNDINHILGLFAGNTAPSNPTNFQSWADTTSTPVVTFKYWNQNTGTWAAYGTMNVSTGIFTSSSACPTCAVTNAANIFTAAQTVSLNTGSLPSALTGTAFRVAQANGVITRLELDSFSLAGSTPAIYSCVTGRNTAAAPNAAQSGDELCSLNTWSYIGPGARSATAIAAIRSYAAQNQSSGNQGSYWRFATTAIGSATLQDQMHVGSDGVWIGSSGSPPTGGALGSGTLNVTNGVYVNGVVALINGGPLGSPSSAGVMPSFTLGGTINGLTITANGTNTLNIAAGKTLTDTSSIGASLLLGATGGGFNQYTGASCTNQFLTGLGSAGVSVCGNVTNAYLSTGSFPSITGVGTLAGLTVTGSFTATGLVTNGDLVNSSITINGSAVSLGGSITVTAAASGVTVGTTTVTGGPGILYNTTSGGTLTALAAVSNAVVSYSGTTLQASTTLPSGLTATNMSLTTPTLGVAAGTSLALGGATIGGNALAVTGTVISGAHAITSASANALVVGLNGVTNPAFNVDASTALQAAGLNVKGAVTGGTVALSLVDSGSNTNLIINAKGTGTIGIGSVSTGAVTITPTVIHSGTTILSAALTYGGVTLANSVTGTGSMVLATSPNLTTPALGVATATTINGLAITANGTNTLNIAAGKTLTDTSGAGAVLLLGSTGGGFTSYGGVNCTNQFLTGIGSAGASVCASVPTNTPIYMGNAFAFVNNGTTVFYGVNSSVTEAVVSQPAGPVVTVKNCYASVTAAAGAGNSWTYTLRQNGSNTAITWTVSGASQVLGSDLTHTVTLAATDLWDIQVVASLAVTPSVSHKITCTAVTTSP